MLRERLDGVDYSYATLSGGMIASELVEGAPLGATIGISDPQDEALLRELFVSPTLAIDFTPAYRDIELY